MARPGRCGFFSRADGAASLRAPERFGRAPGVLSALVRPTLQAWRCRRMRRSGTPPRRGAPHLRVMLGGARPSKTSMPVPSLMRSTHRPGRDKRCVFLAIHSCYDDCVPSAGRRSVRSGVFSEAIVRGESLINSGYGTSGRLLRDCRVHAATTPARLECCLMCHWGPRGVICWKRQYCVYLRPESFTRRTRAASSQIRCALPPLVELRSMAATRLFCRTRRITP